MIAADVMTKDVVTVGPLSTVMQIAERLLEHRISGVPVVDAENHVIGVITEEDLLRLPMKHHAPAWWLHLLSDEFSLTPGELSRVRSITARQVMAENVETISEDTPLPVIAAKLLDHRVKRLPVVRNGKLVGIVSRADLLEALARGPRNARLTPADEELLG